MVSALANIIKNSIISSLDEQVGVSFSGGLDSTLIATVASKYSKVNLYTIGLEDSEDMKYAIAVADKLNLNLNKLVVDKAQLISAYHSCEKLFHKLDFLKIEILTPILLLADFAKSKGESVLLFGSAAEELFVGYERYYRYYNEGKDLNSILLDEFKTLQKREIGWIKKICRRFSIEAKFPLYNKEIANIVFDIPLEERMADSELKKGVLREAASFLSVPKEVISRKKKALQYGSGIHKILLKYHREYEATSLNK